MLDPAPTLQQRSRLEPLNKLCTCFFVAKAASVAGTLRCYSKRDIEVLFETGQGTVVAEELGQEKVKTKAEANESKLFKPRSATT